MIIEGAGQQGQGQQPQEGAAGESLPSFLGSFKDQNSSRSRRSLSKRGSKTKRSSKAGSVGGADLPEGWVRRQDKASKAAFFYKKETGEKAWRHPVTNEKEGGEAQDAAGSASGLSTPREGLDGEETL